MQALPARDQFANAISQLLAKKSISEIRVREICDGAQLSTRSFYNHFQDKYELASYALLKALQDVLKPFLSESEFESLDSIAPWAIAAQGTEESHRFNKAMVDFLVQNPHFFHNLLQDTSQNSPYYEWKNGIKRALYIANERFGDPRCRPDRLEFAAEQIYSGITYTHKTLIKKYRDAKQVPLAEVVFSDKRIIYMAEMLLGVNQTSEPNVRQ